jgi:hypothetical protein
VDSCGECGFDYFTLPRFALSPSIALGGTQHAARLAAPPAALTTRRAPGVWSPLEYACHVRDVLVVQRERIVATQTEDQPVFSPMDRERRVVEDAYNSQEPADVALALLTAAVDLAELVAGLDDRGWARTGVYNFPETAVRDVDWIARHTLHEMTHHLMDVDRTLGANG